jgi:predicted urease superfamily metal-dependent hydrolase
MIAWAPQKINEIQNLWQEENKQTRNVCKEIVERIFVTTPAWFKKVDQI